MAEDRELRVFLLDDGQQLLFGLLPLDEVVSSPVVQVDHCLLLV